MRGCLTPQSPAVGDRLIQSPGELYDIPEIKGQEDFKFDEYLKGGIDY